MRPLCSLLLRALNKFYEYEFPQVYDPVVLVVLIEPIMELIETPIAELLLALRAPVERDVLVTIVAEDHSLVQSIEESLDLLLQDHSLQVRERKLEHLLVSQLVEPLRLLVRELRSSQLLQLQLPLQQLLRHLVIDLLEFYPQVAYFPEHVADLNFQEVHLHLLFLQVVLFRLLISLSDLSQLFLCYKSPEIRSYPTRSKKEIMIIVIKN